MAQVWAVSLAVASLAIGTLGVLGVWLCYLLDAVARGHAPPPSEEADDNVGGKNGLSEAELMRLGGIRVAESADGEEEEEALCPICLDAMEPGRAVRVSCNRAFHQDCVDRWLTISPRCLVCNVWAAPPVASYLPAGAQDRLGFLRWGTAHLLWRLAAQFLVLDEFLVGFRSLTKKRS
ncbi:putative RING-H2 finger protein ATL69 [Phragmites australis]|uniref:putative RING-H2 finger protein ATL69 n=1 Tax=Phragmites australis TaxID=29695 RepID=UPI002D78942F|nr:putative RING-H2 finger protein ATL69 [Phragmites australis]